jgi:cytochrome c6
MDNVNGVNMEIGKKLFVENCNYCHLNKENIIIPEKNLKKESLEMYGMNSLESIIYQVMNGKNGMPSFQKKLNENEISAIANYLLNSFSF